MDRKASFVLGEREHTVSRARLGTYLSLQAALSRIHKAAKAGDGGAVVACILSYLQVCCPEITMADVVQAPWYEIIIPLIKIEAVNILDADFAILRHATGKDAPPVPWDYDERMRYYWIHLIADAYHWSKEQIENLWPEEAIAFIQEIMATDQYEREFAHSLSEIAYHYDKGSKKSKYVPLHRPPWMVVRDPKSLITRLHREMMPVGNVVGADGKEVVH